MSLSTSQEFYVNMKNPPVWNDLFGWEDQDDDVKQFFTEEAYKVKNGVTINGIGMLLSFPYFKTFQMESVFRLSAGYVIMNGFSPRCINVPVRRRKG